MDWYRDRNMLRVDLITVETRPGLWIFAEGVPGVRVAPL